ncbi:MAG: SAM-dependent chlorinase/fluorinase [Thiohalophilus sp.]|jgi:hypothetical protein
MIVLFTDFGYRGPYVGQLKGVLATHAINVPVIDLMHDAPSFNPRSAAYLLAAIIEPFPAESVILAIVDPGVGHPDRRPLIVKADERWFVGPDNGLLNTVISFAREVSAWEITWRPEYLSDSFHGRDLFAPVAAQLALGQMPEVKPLAVESILPDDWPSDLYEILYIDQYGNAMTGIRAGQITNDQIIKCNGHEFRYARTFSLSQSEQPFWYNNSAGLVELAVNSGSVTELLNLRLGQPLTCI